MARPPRHFEILQDPMWIQSVAWERRPDGDVQLTAQLSEGGPVILATLFVPRDANERWSYEYKLRSFPSHLRDALSDEIFTAATPDLGAEAVIAGLKRADILMGDLPVPRFDLEQFGFQEAVTPSQESAVPESASRRDYLAELGPKKRR